MILRAHEPYTLSNDGVLGASGRRTGSNVLQIISFSPILL